MRTMMASDALKVETNRCIYENDEILVAHQVMSFPDGTREVMIVHTIVNGKINGPKPGHTTVLERALTAHTEGGRRQTAATLFLS